MKKKHFSHHLGIVIPCCLILLNGVTTYYSSIRHEDPTTIKIFGTAYAFVWITYAFAVFTSPGYTDGTTVPGAKYVECNKCKLPKPERAHHCKTCNRCVLRMDHHCPWTENCVGFRNIPHFVRFLGSALLVCAYAAYKSGALLLYAYQHRKYLKYFIPNTLRIYAGVAALIGNLFVTLSLLVLWLRVIMDTMNGKTQIELWECERAESLARHKLAAPAEFPFDISIFTNLTSAFGNVWQWPLPFSIPRGSGHVFERLIDCDERWPPAENLDVAKHDFYRMDRWTSYEGEALSDFGVDMATANDKHPCLNELYSDSARSSAFYQNDSDQDVPLAQLHSGRPHQE